mgnify:FL=1|tara:strand:- start:178 stop:360 length:183 start_codon:yes stop_codon:yes gene_type:complete
MGKENTTLPFTRWREKVKDSERNYNRQKICRDPKVELDELNSETDTPSENSPIRSPDASL